MQTISIRRASLHDAEALSALAISTFRETFAAANRPEDIAAYLAASFSPELQGAEIVDPAGAVLLAETNADQGESTLVGYAHLAQGSPPDVVTGPAPWELKRFYVDARWYGRGVAQVLMAEVLRHARARGAQTLWLGVWERNPRAVAFYRKYGFERVGEHVFRLGTDPQIDWLFVRSLDETAHTA